MFLKWERNLHRKWRRESERIHAWRNEEIMIQMKWNMQTKQNTSTKFACENKQTCLNWKQWHKRETRSIFAKCQKLPLKDENLVEWSGISYSWIWTLVFRETWKLKKALIRCKFLTKSYQETSRRNWMIENLCDNFECFEKKRCYE